MSAIITARAQRLVNVARFIRGCVTNVAVRIDAHLMPDSLRSAMLDGPWPCHDPLPRWAHECGGWLKYQSGWRGGKKRSTSSYTTGLTGLPGLTHRGGLCFYTLFARGRLAIPVPVLCG